MDTINFHYEKSVFPQQNKFLNPLYSWTNKYSDTTTLTPKFFGSTTVFVAITDGWHLAQFLFLNILFISFILYFSGSYCVFNWWMNFILSFWIMRAIFGIGFTLFYDYLLISKK